MLLKAWIEVQGPDFVARLLFFALSYCLLFDLSYQKGRIYCVQFKMNKGDQFFVCLFYSVVHC